MEVYPKEALICLYALFLCLCNFFIFKINANKIRKLKIINKCKSVQKIYSKKTIPFYIYKFFNLEEEKASFDKGRIKDFFLLNKTKNNFNFFYNQLLYSQLNP